MPSHSRGPRASVIEKARQIAFGQSNDPNYVHKIVPKLVDVGRVITMNSAFQAIVANVDVFQDDYSESDIVKSSIDKDYWGLVKQLHSRENGGVYHRQPEIEKIGADLLRTDAQPIPLPAGNNEGFIEAFRPYLLLDRWISCNRTTPVDCSKRTRIPVEKLHPASKSKKTTKGGGQGTNLEKSKIALHKSYGTSLRMLLPASSEVTPSIGRPASISTIGSAGATHQLGNDSGIEGALIAAGTQQSSELGASESSTVANKESAAPCLQDAQVWKTLITKGLSSHRENQSATARYRLAMMSIVVNFYLQGHFSDVQIYAKAFKLHATQGVMAQSSFSDAAWEDMVQTGISWLNVALLTSVKDAILYPHLETPSMPYLFGLAARYRQQDVVEGFTELDNKLWAYLFKTATFENSDPLETYLVNLGDTIDEERTDEHKQAVAPYHKPTKDRFQTVPPDTRPPGGPQPEQPDHNDHNPENGEDSASGKTPAKRPLDTSAGDEDERSRKRLRPEDPDLSTAQEGNTEQCAKTGASACGEVESGPSRVTGPLEGPQSGDPDTNDMSVDPPSGATGPPEDHQSGDPNPHDMPLGPLDGVTSPPKDPQSEDLDPNDMPVDPPGPTGRPTSIGVSGRADRSLVTTAAKRPLHSLTGDQDAPSRKKHHAEDQPGLNTVPKSYGGHTEDSPLTDFSEGNEDEFNRNTVQEPAAQVTSSSAPTVIDRDKGDRHIDESNSTARCPGGGESDADESALPNNRPKTRSRTGAKAVNSAPAPSYAGTTQAVKRKKQPVKKTSTINQIINNIKLEVSEDDPITQHARRIKTDKERTSAHTGNASKDKGVKEGPAARKEDNSKNKVPKAKNKERPKNLEDTDCPYPDEHKVIEMTVDGQALRIDTWHEGDFEQLSRFKELIGVKTSRLDLKHIVYQISYAEFMKPGIAQTLRENLEEKHILVTGCPSVISQESLERHLGMSRSIEIQDIWYRDWDVISAHCMGTLDVMKTIMYRKGDIRPMNALDLPGGHLPLDVPRLSDLSFRDTVWQVLRKVQRPTYQESLPMDEVRWALCSSRNAISAPHIDSNGLCTVIAPVNCQKLWIVGRPKTMTLMDSLAFSQFDMYKVTDAEDYEWAPLLLRPGDVLYMRPGTVHAVVTIEPGFTVGEHFYTIETLEESLVSILHLCSSNLFLTNASHDHAVAKTMMRLLHCWRMRLEDDLEGDDVPSIDFTKPRDLRCFVMLATYIHITTFVDDHQRGLSAADTEQFDIAVKDYNDMYTHFLNNYAVTGLQYRGYTFPEVGTCGDLSEDGERGEPSKNPEDGESARKIVCDRQSVLDTVFLNGEMWCIAHIHLQLSKHLVVLKADEEPDQKSIDELETTQDRLNEITTKLLKNYDRTRGWFDQITAWIERNMTKTRLNEWVDWKGVKIIPNAL